MADRINEHTKKEIEEARLRVGSKLKIPCKGCGKELIQNRKWQKFCSTKCKNEWYAAAVDNTIEFYKLKVHWLEREKAELLQEIAELRRKYNDPAKT